MAGTRAGTPRPRDGALPGAVPRAAHRADEARRALAGDRPAHRPAARARKGARRRRRQRLPRPGRHLGRLLSVRPQQHARGRVPRLASAVDDPAAGDGDALRHGHHPRGQRHGPYATCPRARRAGEPGGAGSAERAGGAARARRAARGGEPWPLGGRGADEGARRRMKAAPFEYFAADSAAAAVALKAEHGEDARFLAGGQSLMPAMNFRLAQPAVLIDINPARDLDFLVFEKNFLRIGALTRNRTLERDPLIAKHCPLIREAIVHVAHPQIRNRGTLAGNLAHADPASEMPAVMLALGARMKARSAKGERWIAARDFFTGIFSTALAPDELL